MSSKCEATGAVSPPDAETSAIVQPVFLGMVKYRRVPSVTKGGNFRSLSWVRGVYPTTFGAGTGARNQNASATIAKVASTPSRASQGRCSHSCHASDAAVFGTVIDGCDVVC